MRWGGEGEGGLQVASRWYVMMVYAWFVQREEVDSGVAFQDARRDELTSLSHAFTSWLCNMRYL